MVVVIVIFFVHTSKESCCVYVLYILCSFFPIWWGKGNGPSWVVLTRRMLSYAEMTEKEKQKKSLIEWMSEWKRIRKEMSGGCLRHCKHGVCYVCFVQWQSMHFLMWSKLTV